jgi:hypothetical protein
MKNFLRYKSLSVQIIIFIGLICIFQACQKPLEGELEPEGSEKARQKKLKFADDYSRITVIDGTLKFIDQAHLTRVLTQLENEYEAWNEAFEDTWSHLSDDAYNAKVAELNFDEDKPFKDFENLFYGQGFRSLRMRIDAAEDTWLANGLPAGQNPDVLYVESDEFLRVVKSRTGKIIVGSITYDEGVLNSTTPKLYQPCDTKRYDDFIKPYDNLTKRYYGYVIIRKMLWYGMIKAKVKSYEKKNGAWKKYRTHLTVQSGGYFRETPYCANANPFTSQIKDKRKRWRTSVGYKLATPSEAYAQSYDIRAGYDVNGDHTLFYLIW